MTKCNSLDIPIRSNYSSLALNYNTSLSDYSLESRIKPEQRLDLNRIPNGKDLYQKLPSYNGSSSEAQMMPTSPRPSKPFSASSVYDSF